jgi:ribosomal protein S18 acetylase RimI-like enzyme
MPRSAAPFRIRPATAADLPACARLGAALTRFHHRLDPQRFFVVPGMRTGYAWWLGKELKRRAVAILVAVRPGARGGERVVGFAYGRLEPRDWMALRDACGVGVDLMVDPAERERGVGTALVEALVGALAERGAPRVVLGVASGNAGARRLFAARGFRPTMIEMTRELPVSARPARGAGRGAAARRAPGRAAAAVPARRRSPRRR